VRFTIGGTRDASLVRLAAGDKITHTSRQLLVPINQVAYVGGDERAVKSSHVHLAVLVERHGAWEGAEDLAGARVLVQLSTLFIFEDPGVVR